MIPVLPACPRHGWVRCVWSYSSRGVFAVDVLLVHHGHSRMVLAPPVLRGRQRIRRSILESKAFLLRVTLTQCLRLRIRFMLYAPEVCSSVPVWKRLTVVSSLFFLDVNILLAAESFKKSFGSTIFRRNRSDMAVSRHAFSYASSITNLGKGAG